MKGSITVKKIVSVLFILSVFIVCIVGSSLAEGFTIHSGTTFGMSKEEVKACEDNNGYIYKDVTDNPNYTHCLYNHDVWSIEGSLAGVNRAKIAYHFMGGSLDACVYQFDGKEFATDVISKLKQKYGSIDQQITDISLVSLIPEALASHIAIEKGVFSSKLVDVGAWRIPVESGNSVIITYANFTWEDRGSVLEKMTHVSYELHSDEIIEAAIAEMVTQQQSELDDL